MRPIAVDNFAGFGGASLGVEWATGRPVDHAINHSQAAITAHQMNHPDTTHHCEDVFEIDPRKIARRNKVGLAWFSPDCCHHSVARGGKPREKGIRALAWITVRWAYHCRPFRMFLENVREFQTWGPLDEDGRIIPSEKARTFEAFKACLGSGLDPSDPTWGEIRETIPDVPPEALKRGLGYNVEHRVLRACDYGAPTTRQRFFMVMTADGAPIVWPKPTHGEPGSDAVLRGDLLPWPTAADCINWTLPCYSIFMTPEEVKARGLRIKRPLVEKTMMRIGRGTWRYVINARQPFIVIANHGGDQFRGQGVNEPMQTITGARDARGLCVPFIAGVGGRAGQTLEKSAGDLMPTITAKADKALVAAFLSGTGGPGYAGKPTPVDRPMGTLLQENHEGLVAAFLTKYHSGATGGDLSDPMPTMTSNSFIKRPGGCPPVGVVTSHLVKLRGTCKDGQLITEPMPTITGGGNHIGEVRAFLIKYYGQGCGAELREPMHTVTSKDRMGLVMTLGGIYQIADIGLRMLVPREQARAQGFPDTFMLLGTQAEQVSQIGNSVPPQFAEALVRANYREPRATEIRTRRVAGSRAQGVAVV